MTIRIAMWSGPRNLSTAMMRSFSARGDCACVDEPFYAHYLAQTGLDHPMRDEVLASQPQNWMTAAAGLMAPVAQPIQYQKHMVQHMLPGMDLNWAAHIRHAFLIRDPARVVGSFADKRGLPQPFELGFARQVGLFDELADLQGRHPVVIDAADIRRNPEGMLRALCGALDISFTPAMLSWPAGPRREDGVWGRVWYEAVEASTGFAPPESDPPQLLGELAEMADTLRPDYEKLAHYALRPA